MKFFNEWRDVVIAIIVIILIIILMVLFDLEVINFNAKNGDYYDSFERFDDNVVDNANNNVNNNVESDNSEDAV